MTRLMEEYKESSDPAKKEEFLSKNKASDPANNSNTRKKQVFTIHNSRDVSIKPFTVISINTQNGKYRYEIRDNTLNKTVQVNEGEAENNPGYLDAILDYYEEKIIYHNKTV